MKITCTAEEKSALIETLGKSVNCPFDRTDGFHCNHSAACETCIEKNIEWEITGES